MSGDTTSRVNGYGYASGTFRRLAENEYGEERVAVLSDYGDHPSKEEVVESMVENGWGRQESEAAVDQLWDDEVLS